MGTRDANTAGGTLESGTSEKQDFHDTPPAELGMGTVGGDPNGGLQLPAGNPDKKVAGGFVIR
jgi:hypothetical protein